MSTESPKEARWSVAPYFVVDDIVATANFYRDKLGFAYDELHGEQPAFTIVWRSGAAIMLRSVGSHGFVHPNGDALATRRAGLNRRHFKRQSGLLGACADPIATPPTNARTGLGDSRSLP